VLTVDLFDRFLQERLYLKNVSAKTTRSYKQGGNTFQPAVAEPRKEAMLDESHVLLTTGLSPVSVDV
jgi:hypothetical protein